MCAIYGILARDRVYAIDRSWIARMGSVAIHRGPDDSGEYFGGGLAMGMRRLSIIDIEGGHQPLSTPDGSVQLICNGEIYNFRELRKSLESDGHRFSTNSDCEVIVHLYQKHGSALVEHLDGMFAFALWDQRRRRLLLARDRIGIKPLYYLADAKRLIFASEIKSILQVPGVDTQVDSDGLQDLVTLGYSLAPQTLFAGIRKLEPATLLTCEDGAMQEHQYWRYRRAPEPIGDEREAADLFRATLEKSVTDQMVADVPLGAFLSGGIDSSSIVGLMSKHSSKAIKTFSIGFDTSDDLAGRYYDELPYARRVSELFDTEHHEIVVRPNVVRLLPKLIWHMDEPSFDSALMTTFLVAEFARRDVAVILSGAGGDELMGGYRRYLGSFYSRLLNKLPRFVRRHLLLPFASLLPSDRHTPAKNFIRYARQFLLTSERTPDERYASYVDLFSAAERDALIPSRVEGRSSMILAALTAAESTDAVDRLMEVDLTTQLPDDILLLTDKMTMAASLECRVPFLGNAMIDLSTRIPGNMKIRGLRLKALMKDALGDLLPRDILHRRKRGFGAPIGAWMKRESRPLFQLLLAEQQVGRRGFFDPKFVNRTMQLHFQGREDYSNHLLALANFELWCCLYLDGQTPEDVSAELRERLDWQDVRGRRAGHHPSS